MSAKDRKHCLELVEEACTNGARRKKACELLGLSVRTLQRWDNKPEDERRGPLTPPKSALTEGEKDKLVEVANSPEYRDLTPWKIVPKLADEGIYLASESSFYRTLKSRKMLTHRSKAQPGRKHALKQLIATGPNQVWSWDITYLKTLVKGQFYYLYLPLDVFSRMIVHWEIHDRESSSLASKMIEKACQAQGIKSGDITLHADNGSPMKGATTLATLEKLGICASFSRPRVSDDNAYSESLFKTLKYCTGYPEHGFKSIEAAREWAKRFAHWYNHEHLHSGINWVTPGSRHAGLDQEILRKRKVIYEEARQRNPSRWSQTTRQWAWESEVILNPEKEKEVDRNTEIQKAS